MSTPDSDRLDDAADYRAISTPAVIGGLLGLVSVLTFFLPWLSLVPYLGLVVSFVAARSIAAEPELRTGTPFALVGIALSALALAGGATRAFYTDHHHFGSAMPLAERFVDALAAGEPEIASELTRPWAERLDPERAADLYREDPDATERLNDFLEQPAVAALQGGARLVSTSQTTLKRGRVLIVCTYIATDSGREIAVTLSRPVANEANPIAAWRVAKVRPVPTKS